MAVATRRALVTGGAGFIGSHLVEALLQKGWGVAVLDDLSTGRRDNLPTAGIRFVQGSVLEATAVEAAIEGADVVFHLAACVSVPLSFDDPAGSFAVNATGTLNVLEAARRHGARRFIYASSCAVYGDGPEPCKSERSPLSPQSPYAVGKLAGEELVVAYGRCFGLEAMALRYFNVFGPRQRHDSSYAAVIPIFISRLLAAEPLIVYGDGQQTRDFTYVENITRANLLAADARGLAGEVVNCGCGEEVQVSELIAELGRITGRTPAVTHEPQRHGDVRFSVASNLLAERLLSYRPSVFWREGLRRTVQAALVAVCAKRAAPSP